MWDFDTGQRIFFPFKNGYRIRSPNDPNINIHSLGCQEWLLYISISALHIWKHLCTERCRYFELGMQDIIGCLLFLKCWQVSSKMKWFNSLDKVSISSFMSVDFVFDSQVSYKAYRQQFMVFRQTLTHLLEPHIILQHVVTLSQPCLVPALNVVGHCILPAR